MGVHTLKITVMDIENKEFKRGFRGYEVNDVDEFLEDIAEDYETLYKENSSLKEKIEVLDEKLDNYKMIENTINSTLLMAQKSSEQLKINSEDEAQMILNRANETAKKIIDNAQSEVIKIKNEYDKIKNQYMSFKTKYKNFMISQTELFNELEKDFARNFSISHTKETPLNTKFMENEKESLFPKENEVVKNLENMVTLDSDEIEFLNEKFKGQVELQNDELTNLEEEIEEI
jgi:cell division initiation protein